MVKMTSSRRWGPRNVRTQIQVTEKGTLRCGRLSRGEGGEPKGVGDRLKFIGPKTWAGEQRGYSWVVVVVCRESQTVLTICQKWEWRCPVVDYTSKAYSCISVEEEYAAQRTRGISEKVGSVEPRRGGVQVRDIISVVHKYMRGVS